MMVSFTKLDFLPLFSLRSAARLTWRQLNKLELFAILFGFLLQSFDIQTVWNVIAMYCYTEFIAFFTVWFVIRPVGLLTIARTVRSFAPLTTGEASHRSFCLVTVGTTADWLWERGCRWFWGGRSWRHSDVSASTNFEDLATWAKVLCRANARSLAIWEDVYTSVEGFEYPLLEQSHEWNFVEWAETQNVRWPKFWLSYLPWRRGFYLHLYDKAVPIDIPLYETDV